MAQWQNGHLNTASMYNQLGDPNQFNLSQPPSAFPNQTFQPGSVVPAKRTHDQVSRSQSQTPSYGNYGGQQFPNAPTPYQHLQQPGSNNATPSPTMSNQQFRQPAPQQRMQNASPSPFPQQQPGNFGNQMSPSTPQQNNPAASMPQQGQAAGYNQSSSMTPNMMNMQGLAGPMSGQLNNMMGGASAQRERHQAALMQYQAQLKRAGMMAPRNVGGQPNHMNNMGGQQGGAQMANGGQMSAQMQQAMLMNQQKKANFLRQLQGLAQSQGRPFNPAPHINNQPVDLYMLFSMVSQQGGSPMVDRNQQWQAVAHKLGFQASQHPNIAEEIKQVFIQHVYTYEQQWLKMKMNAKRQEATMHARQMAGIATPTQASPTRTMQPPNQPNQYHQLQQAQQGLQGQQPPQATPVQANAQLPPNGMSTPQQMLQHQRSNSVKKPDQMTPQARQPSMTAPSPQSVNKVQRSPSVKREPEVVAMKSEEPQSTNYLPNKREKQSLDGKMREHDGGYDIDALGELGNAIARLKPNMPTVDEMGVIDMRAISLSLASGIHGEVRYALDALVVISRDERIHFELDKCEDLLDYIVDCAEEQVDMLSEEAAEVSDALDLPPYEDIMRGSRSEAETLQEVPEFGTQAYELDRSADRLIAITTILRNLSFFEHNHRLLVSTALIKWLSNTIRLLGTRNMLLRTFYNTLDFYKDMITFLSNTTQSLELPTRDDALHILHFLLAFAPQPSPSYTEGETKVRFTSFVPAVHRFLPPAVDCLAKLLARQDPNRMLYRSIFTASSSSLAVSESPLDLLTRAFALSISVLPDRSKGSLGNATQLRIIEARKSYLCQGMLAADILASLAPGNDTRLARAWIESEDGWTIGLLNLAALLSVDRSQPVGLPKGRELGMDTESFKLITHRALSMMKRLAEKAGKGSISHAVPNGMLNGDSHAEGDEEAEKQAPKWEGIPQGHAILGALMMPNTDKVALGLLCGLHEMAMQNSG